MDDELEFAGVFKKRAPKTPRVNNQAKELEEILSRRKRLGESVAKAQREAIERDELELIKPAFSTEDEKLNKAIEHANEEEASYMKTLKDGRPPPGVFETEPPDFESHLSCPVELASDAIDSLISDAAKKKAVDGMLADKQLNSLLRDTFLNEDDSISEESSKVILLALTREPAAMFESAHLSMVTPSPSKASWRLSSSFFGYLVLQSLPLNRLNVRRIALILSRCIADNNEMVVYWLTVLLCSRLSLENERPIGQLITQYASSLNGETYTLLAKKILNICSGKIDGLSDQWRDDEAGMFFHRFRRVSFGLLSATGLVDVLLTEALLEQRIIGEHLDAKSLHECRETIGAVGDEWEKADPRVQFVVSFLINDIKKQQDTQPDLFPAVYNKWESIANLLDILATLSINRPTHSVIFKSAEKILVITSKTQLQAHHSFVEFLRFLKRRYESRSITENHYVQSNMQQFFENDPKE